MGIEIVSTLSPKIGFASHQNAIPILRELDLRSDDERDYESLVLSLTADPPFLESKAWRVDALHRGTDVRIDDRDVKLNGGYLSGLTESLSGEVRLTLTREGEVLASVCKQVELLARNHWGGCGSMAELLPAFCMPNDPAVDRVLKAASDVLQCAGKPSGINGYADRSRQRVWEIASAVWSAVVGLDLSYALPPASFEQVGQKVRTPGTILEGKMATCLDATLLFAASLEQAGLHPVLILTKGHAFAGVWLEPREFPQLITEDAAALRKRVDLHELVVFETTLALQRPAIPFSNAIEHGTRELTDEAFQMAIDVKRARMQRIRPMAQETREGRAQEAEAAVETGPPMLEDAPSLPAFDMPDVTEAPLTPADRVTLWLRKLLDLTARNRLLHLSEAAKCVPLICPNAGLLEESLAAGRRIKILSLPDFEASGRDSALYSQQKQESLTEAYARDALQRGESVSPLTRQRLETELTDLFRKAHSDLIEGGANTLFLAVGFLKWKKSETDARSYRAPLILLPVKLDRRSAVSPVTMLAHEDEPRFNMTLLEMLRHDFELEISDLDRELPMREEGGVDVEKVWNTVRHAVRDAPGFEVVTDVVLGTFSFAKYLMWKDLADRRDVLMQNHLVRHLLERKGEGLRDGTDFPRPEDLDIRYDASQLFTPLPADSSQLAAVVASASDFDFVLDGPPGTGKSQTIANMIAHNLGLGRRVLFVSEKRAALDVVYRRLKERGLGEFCLEVHSTKTSKTEVVRQLERAWETRDNLTEQEWRGEAEEVTRLRDRLNGLVTLLHQRHPCGITLHDAIGRVVRDGHDGLPRLRWPAGTVHDAAMLSQMREVAKRVDLNLGDVLGIPAGFARIPQVDWSNDWQTNLAAAATEFMDSRAAMLDARGDVLAATELPVGAETGEQMEQLLEIGGQLLHCHGRPVAYAFEPDVGTRMEGARRAIGWIQDYRSQQETLSVCYEAEAIRRIDTDALEKSWRESGRKFWFLATLAKKKVAQDLAAQGGTQGVPDVARDLPVLRRMWELGGMIDGMDATLSGLPGWAKLATDLPKLVDAADRYDTLNETLSRSAMSPDHLTGLRATARKLAVDANAMLQSDGTIARGIRRFETTLRRFQNAFRHFRELCGYPEGEHFSVEDWSETAEAILKERSRLNAWCNWCRVRGDAQRLGLAPLVEGIEQGAVEPGRAAETFEVAYARWFAEGTIDAEPTLRRFVAAEHLSAIEAFRKLNDRLAQLSTRYIRAMVCRGIPSRQAIPRNSGFFVLQRELQKQRRHKPLRQLAIEMGDALTSLAPCMLMSPLSIAQYLPPDAQLFDLVIFDEASQIAPWDAVGAIARGKHVVIAGDPNQMPPTNFFARAAGTGDGDGAEQDAWEDMESILDECLGAGVPRHSLTWHYRSRHESLIAFSNQHYYDNRLLTFPAATTRLSAVAWRKVDGVYARGKQQTNQAEAEAMVGEVVKRLTDSTASERKTIAIVTLNANQQQLVEDLLDKARRERPEIEPYFSHDLTEPVIVKNLETVQGDERDVIMLGIGYGPGEPGGTSMPMNFGPLNRDGGWRRLNVAITRARQEMIIFSSFGPGMMDLSRVGGKARAIRDLKHFLEFAERGPRALGEAVAGSVGGYDSPFEEAVARALRERGWQVVPQVGVSRFRIDVGIVHPDRPGDFLAGVECDGATYHRAATARDRDKVRALILEGLGWRLVRVWSTDWWVDKAGALGRLHRELTDILQESRERHKAEEEAAARRAEQERAEREAEAAKKAIEAATSPAMPAMHPYRLTDFTPLAGQISPERFYDSEYDPVLSSLVTHVIESEAPIADDLLVSRIAGAHRFKKAGRLIRERVMDIALQHHHVAEDPSGGNFVWKDRADPALWNTYRASSEDEVARDIDQIPAQEIRAAAATLAPGCDPVRDVAQMLGLQRVTHRVRERLSAITSSPGCQS